MDGTLIDSRADLTASVNHVLKEFGYPEQTIDQVVPKIGNGLRQLLRDTTGLMDTEKLLQAKKIFDDHYHIHCMDQTKLYLNVEECLNEFSDNYKLAVVTNKPKQYADKILEDLGIMSLIDLVVGGDTYSEAKPHPMPLLEAMKQLNAKGGSTLMVGDGIQDIEAAQAAGVKLCVVRYGFGFRPEFVDMKPDFVINNFKDLKEILK